MKDWVSVLRRSVSLDDYRSSPRYLGRIEPLLTYRRHLIPAVVAVVEKGLGDCPLVATSLYVPAQLDWLMEDYSIAEAEIDEFIVPLLSTDLVRSVDLALLGDDYESPEYQEAVEGISADIRLVSKPLVEELARVAQVVMGIGGVKGHFFQIYPRPGLIVYPHDEIGYGFIGSCETPAPVLPEELVRELPDDFRFVPPS